MSFWKRCRNEVLHPIGSKSALRAASVKCRVFTPRVFNGRHLRIEHLEDRCVLSAATVNTELDIVNFNDGVTSLREALFFTNSLIGHDTIQFDSALNGKTILLTLGELTVSDSLAIIGPGPNQLAIDSSGNDPTPAVDNADGSRVFNIDDENNSLLIDVSITGLTLTGGDASGNGGAILNKEVLTLVGSTVSGNSAAANGGGIYSSAASSLSVVDSTISTNSAITGAGISSIGANLSITGSTVSGNVASGQAGGLFSQNNALVVSNSTFSGNTAGAEGGGIYVQPNGSGTAQFNHSTITDNQAASGGGISIGGSSGTTNLDHSIVAGNRRSLEVHDDIAGTVYAHFSLIGDNSGATIIDNGDNQIGNANSPIDALLGPLADNGGATLTHALLLNSPAVDAGDPNVIAGVNSPLNDQRGAPFGRVKNGRGAGAQVDIGAYEIQTGSINGNKWNDLDGDGEWDQPEEPGLEGWVIFLDTNTNRALDNGETFTLTDASGNYSFTDLAPGNYAVAEIMLPGWTQTSPAGPSPTGLIANGGFETGDFTGWTHQNTGSGTFVINSGTIDPISPDGPSAPYSGAYNAFTNSGAGLRVLYQDLVIPAGSHLTLQWADRIRNHNAIFQDPNQEYRVEIRNTANQVLATVFSTNPGEQTLRDWMERSADLSAYAGQTIRIAFVEQDNLFYFNVHVDNVRIIGGSTSEAIPVAIGDGQIVNDVNFGNWFTPSAEIHGAKWNDLNGNGQWDQPIEPGVEGWTIFLDANNNGGLDNGETWTTTGPDGSYSFTGLEAGNYFVAELIQPGWTQTSPGPLNTSSLIVNGGFETGTFSGWTLENSGSGAFAINNGTLNPSGPDGPLPAYHGTFSALSNTSIGTYSIYQDVVIPGGAQLTLQWADRIRNHSTTFVDPTQEYRVEIRNSANQVLATVFSTNPGDPLIREWTERNGDLSAFAGQAVRIAFVAQNSTSNLNIHVDNVRITNASVAGAIPVAVDAGQIATEINFGNKIVPPAEIHGTKWNDLNGNGLWDQPSEPALAGTIIYLDNNANGSLDYGETWTTTGPDGSYSFTGLTAGDYIVAEVATPGWTQSYPNDVEIGNERLFVLRGTGNSLSILELDPVTGSQINSFTAPALGTPGPQGLALGPNSLFFIEGGSSATHTLWELDPDTGVVIDSDIVDASLTGSVAGLGYLDGKVYVEKYNSNQILVWDPVSDTLVTTLSVAADLIGGLTGAADLGVLFDSNSSGNVFKIDPNTGTVLATFSPGVGSLNLGLAYVNGELLAAGSTSSGTAYRISPTTGAVLGSITLGGTGNISGLAGDGATTASIDGAHLVTLADGQAVTDVNFGNWIAPPAEINGSKWNDLNGNGVWDQPSEPALAGRIIYLDTNSNGALDNGEPWTTTASDGSYSFTGLAAGEYIVAEVIQPGWTQTHPDEVHADFERLFAVRGIGTAHTIYELNPTNGSVIKSFVAPITGSLGNEGLALGANSLFYINGSGSGTHTLFELNPNTGAVIDSDVIDATLLGLIGGLAYLDGKVYVEKSNTNQILVWDPISDAVVTTLNVSADLIGGLTGAAELGLLFGSSGSGNVVTINPANGTILATLSPGVGPFSGLAYVHGELRASRTGTSGTAYRIDPDNGAVLGTFALGATGTAGGLGADGATSIPLGVHVVELVPGQNITDINFGNWIAPPGEIHGFKWNDLDGDGTWDQPNEPGLDGWTIFLDANGNGALDSGETSTVTGAGGAYSFTNLAPGHYKVAEVVQSGWIPTITPKFVTLDAGENSQNVNFGNRELPGSISGQKWNDLDGDGEKEEGELGLPGWTIFIDQNENGILDDGELSTTTDDTGNYAFTNLVPGQYAVGEVQQTGWTQTYAPPLVIVTPGLDVTNVDFGNQALPGSIRGQKWHDLDGDGVKESGEPGLPGWTIFIDQNVNGVLDDGELSTTTDVDGNYEFTGLTPGQYVVAELQQAGWQQTSPTLTDLAQILGELNAHNAAISALVPNRFDFSEGDVGFYISDGLGDMYDDGNLLSTNLAGAISYTGGVVTASDSAFGIGSNYFTAKYTGLFVLVATDISIVDFAISGGNGADGSGNVDGDLLLATANDQEYTIFLKRVYNAGDPSINHIIIIPGDGTGISHSISTDTNDDLHTINGLQTVGELYYLLVSTAGGEFLANADVMNIAHAFLESVSPGNTTNHHVTVGPGQNVTNVDIGNLALPPLSGDYNLNGTVDAADYTLWRDTLGWSGLIPYEGADGSGNGAVGPEDYQIWNLHFGESLPPSDPGGGAGALAFTDSGFEAGEAIVPAPAETVATSADATRRADFAILEVSSRQDSAPRSRERTYVSGVAKSASDNLLLLLAMDRLGRSTPEEFSVIHDRANGDLQADGLDSQSFIDESLAVALAEW